MLERILQFSLAQRFLVLLAAVLLALVGATSWQSLNLDAVPDITTNQVQINTRTGGLAPEEAERLVTFPIETAMGGLPGLEQVRSISQYGLSQVTVTFRDDVDTYLARQLVTERLTAVREELPSGVQVPALAPVSTGLGDIYMYALDSKTRSTMELHVLQDWLIEPQLKTVPGVADVNVADGSEKQFQVVVDPSALVSRGVSVNEVIEALERNNQNAGGGVLERNGERTLIRSVGTATGPDDLERIVVATQAGIPVLVRDVAKVREGIPVVTGVSTMNGKEVVVATAMMLKGANGRTVADAVDRKIQEIRTQLPKDVTLTTTYNRSDLVNTAVGTVQTSLIEGGILVIVVLLVLLGSLRGAVIAASAIPLSMLFAIICMNRFGISGNLMSLGAIDFGIIVDGAVIMVENCVRRLAEAREHLGRPLTSEEKRKVVGRACSEVRKVTQFGELIIIATFIPILALEGTEGKMFRPMAATFLFALVGALVLSLTVVPTLCSLFLSNDTREGRNRVMELFQRLYAPVLRFALRHKAIVVGSAVAIFLVAAAILPRLGSEFIPTLDEGSFLVQPVRLRTVGSGETLRLVTAVERKIKEVPEVIVVFSKTGTPEVASDPMPLSLGDTYVMLKPRHQWRPGLTKEALLEEVEEKASQVPGQGYGFTQPIQMRFSELVSGVKADVGIKLFGEDLDVLRKKAGEIADAVRGLPGASDVSVEQVDEIPVLQIEADRDALARSGVTIADVQRMVGVAMGGEPVGQVVQGDKRFELTVRLPDAVQNSVEAIKALPVMTSSGGTVRLSDVARIRNVPAPAQVSREDGKRRVVVQMNVRGRDLGSFVAAAKSAIASKVELPEGYYTTWGGQFENLERARTRLTIVVPLSLALIFALLYTTFGSARLALLIFTGVPLAITGGILALALRGLPFSISAGVGFIALSGVAVLNGVVMVSAINRLREEGREFDEAVRLGATERLRPVLMTALVAALGFVPMALNSGIGSEVQRPLATVVIGGIFSATLLTLVVLPVLYTWFERGGRPAPSDVTKAQADEIIHS